MLQEMRKYSKSWVANIFLGVLALSFVSWGVNDMVNARTDTAAAKVGGQGIDQQEFSRDYRNAMKQEGVRRGGQSLTDDEARKLGLGTAVLEQAINAKALDNAAKKLGLTASDAQVVATIQRYSAFAGLTGQFDRQVFLRAIGEFGYSEQGFIEYIRDETARTQLVRAVQGNFMLPPGYARSLLSYFLEVRAADYFVVEDKALGTVPVPPDATLEAYVKAHAGRFSTPEYRDVSFAYITPADVTPQLSVTDAQLKQYYEEHKGEYVIAEKRDFLQLQFTTEAAAKAAYAKATSGTKFEDLTDEKGNKAVPQAGLTAEDIDPSQSKALFALAKDGIAPPHKTPAGSWTLFKVTAIDAGSNRTLDQVKDEVRGKVLEELAIGKLSDISNAYTDASSGGDSLTEAAKKVGMKTGHVTIDANGFAPDRQKAAAPDDAEFREIVFRSEPGEEGDPQTTKTGAVYVVAVAGAIPPKVKPLAEVREAALAGWMAQERARLLKLKAQELTAKANKEGSLEAAAKSVGATIQKSPGIQHSFTDATFSPEVVQTLFEAKPNQTVSGPRAQGGGYVIAKITGIVHPQLPEKSPQFQMAQRQLSAQAAATLTESYTAQQRDAQKVTYNKKVIDSVTGNSEAQ